MGQISVNRISKSWGSFAALESIDLEVREGEFLSILGPSGCGKSTLLRIIAGLEEPSGGEIHIAGRNVTRDPVWKRRIGFVFQNFALWPHLSVFRNISMGLELRGTPSAELRARVTEALAMVQLEALADRLPTQLSGGQQQRVALARAIVLKPDVLLLDEPLSALDKNLRQDMQVELKTLQQTLGLTTVFVTHDQEEALSLSDRVVVMNKGVIEQLNTPHAIYNSPVSEYVARFVGEAFFFRGQVENRGAIQCIRLAEDMVIPVEGAEQHVGRGVIAFVRPEWVTLDAPKAQEEQELPRGVVDRLMFFGQSSDYLIKFGDRQMRVKRRPDAPEFQAGDVVALRCQARMLPNEALAP
ncbi:MULTISPECIES: ABC transporter ATP-binding protein [unclassified Chelatococcus]|uniref:ABC transporter ATP-binding protein n=1 Tax=unclassified Chelatococcus TaxID=2638111 RepID=UPI001BD16914|nr:MULTISPECIES: ABC transporter ATP-binding protein [unclassified Chelatococcus]CAH1660871.1 Spermidine/putrescine import ATP-binding protein PotA [Hyphomicrobiales bacterium]MBS7741181.1 ABC transporter ATP-binding protein [Chelatococcus sp. HY11]MBX3545367.1 ABC transporter ATP-binding protein [Chelatococcus sp.]MCO5078002.1 ABC transporter ATP-binding protein [Chelatococcus sp.]CAH1683268.1 Spermidine/putrescine import ATP-binding protein PotA [Hyphomicrobiales bacterium]